MGFWLALSGKARTWLYVAGAALVAIVAAYFRGRSDAVEAEHERELNEYVETRRRMDETTIPNDAADVREWLRKRGQSDGNM
jgi:dienelactone hydrolase